MIGFLCFGLIKQSTTTQLTRQIANFHQVHKAKGRKKKLGFSFTLKKCNATTFNVRV
jgi:hypothetical protein